MLDKPHRILIVDDDPDILTNLSDILSEEGYEIVTATSGKSAMEQVNRRCTQDHCRLDLCLLDFKMPGMDGVELVKEIQIENPGLRTIMITAYAGEDGVQRALAAGTWKIMEKPVEIRDLLVIIEDALNN